MNNQSLLSDFHSDSQTIHLFISEVLLLQLACCFAAHGSTKSSPVLWFWLLFTSSNAHMMGYIPRIWAFLLQNWFGVLWSIQRNYSAVSIFYENPWKSTFLCPSITWLETFLSKDIFPILKNNTKEFFLCFLWTSSLKIIPVRFLDNCMFRAVSGNLVPVIQLKPFRGYWPKLFRHNNTCCSGSMLDHLQPIPNAEYLPSYQR